MEAISLYLTVMAVYNLAETRAEEPECNATDTEEQIAYIGWPLTITCDIPLLEYDFYYEGSLSNNVTCEMQFTESKVAFFNTSYMIDETGPTHIINVTEDTPKKIQVKLWEDGGSCCIHNIELILLNSNQTCEEATKSELHVLPRSFNQDYGTVKFPCEAFDDEPGVDIDKYAVKWYYNCNESLPDGVEKSFKEQLTISKIDYRKHPGNYSCSVGDERFLIQHNLCVKHQEGSSIVSLHCEKSFKFDEGDNATIICFVYAGREEDGWRVKFYPVRDNARIESSLSCTITQGGMPEGGDRVSCSLLHISDTKTCFNYIPSDEEWEKTKNEAFRKMKISYRIRNIRADDFATFRIEVSHDLFTDAKDMDDVIVQLRTHPDSAAIFIGCSIGGFVALLLLTALCLWLRLEIRYLLRQTSCSPELKDPREFGAYIGYYWQNESGEPAENQKYKRLIMSLRTSLEEMRCPVYDARFAASKFQWDLENILQVQHMCDRVVIVLTPEYINNEENDFEIFSNFLDSTFVFIKTSGVDEAVKKLNEERRSALMMHLKRNYVITWRSKSDKLSRRFLMKLELAMPKRPVMNHNDKCGLIEEETKEERCPFTGYERAASEELESYLLV